VKKKLAVEIFVSAVVVFDMFGSWAYHLPVWPFFLMWAGAMLEVEFWARVIGFVSRHVQFLGPRGRHSAT